MSKEILTSIDDEFIGIRRGGWREHKWRNRLNTPSYHFTNNAQAIPYCSKMGQNYTRVGWIVQSASFNKCL